MPEFIGLAVGVAIVLVLGIRIARHFLSHDKKDDTTTSTDEGTPTHGGSARNAYDDLESNVQTPPTPTMPRKTLDDESTCDTSKCAVGDRIHCLSTDDTSSDFTELGDDNLESAFTREMSTTSTGSYSDMSVESISSTPRCVPIGEESIPAAIV